MKRPRPVDWVALACYLALIAIAVTFVISIFYSSSSPK